MYYRRITIRLDLAEVEALDKLSQRERRDPREQAAMLVSEGLRGAGVLRPDGERKRAAGVSDASRNI